MDIRVLRYFLAICREQSFSAAGEKLYVTQPTLSRQIAELEQELGVRLFIRGTKGKKLTLTEEGKILKKRAEEMLILLEKTESELKVTGENLNGDLYIGCAETEAFNLPAAACSRFIKAHPSVRLHLYSANADDVLEKMDHGILDFGLLIGHKNLENYEFIQLPVTDQWGLLVPADSELAEKTDLVPEELYGQPLIISDQEQGNLAFTGWLKRDLESLNITARYNLLYNAAYLVEQKLGNALCLEGLVPAVLSQKTRFVPLDPPLKESIWFVWRSSASLSPQAKAFLCCFQEVLDEFQKNERK